MIDDEQSNDELELTDDEAVEEPKAELEPGFHVTASNGAYVGRYETEEDAQAFIDGHLVPQNLDGTINHVS